MLKVSDFRSSFPDRLLRVHREDCNLSSIIFISRVAKHHKPDFFHWTRWHNRNCPLWFDVGCMQEYYARRIIQIRCGIHTTVYMRDYAGTSVGEVNYSLFRCLLRSLLLRFFPSPTREKGCTALGRPIHYRWYSASEIRLSPVDRSDRCNVRPPSNYSYKYHKHP